MNTINSKMKMTNLPLIGAALLLVATTAPGCGNLANNTAPVQKVAYAPDGSLVLFSTAAIFVYDGRLQTQGRRISLDAFPTPWDYQEFTYSLSADGTVAAVAYFPNGQSNEAGNHGQVGLYRLSDGTLSSRFDLTPTSQPGTTQELTGIALSPDKTRLFMLGTTAQNAARVVDTTTGTPVWLGGDDLWIIPAVWSADGQTLFAVSRTFGNGEEAEGLVALDGETGAVKWSQGQDHVEGLALIGSGTTLTGPVIAPCENHQTFCPLLIQSWSPADGTPTTLLPEPNAFVVNVIPAATGFACNANDVCAIRLNQNGGLYIQIYKTDGTILRMLSMGGEGEPSTQGSMAISPDGQLIAVAATPGTRGGVSVYSIETGERVGTVDFPSDTY